jgi:hypothetical protein
METLASIHATILGIMFAVVVSFSLYAIQSIDTTTESLIAPAIKQLNQAA